MEKILRATGCVTEIIIKGDLSSYVGEDKFIAEVWIPIVTRGECKCIHEQGIYIIIHIDDNIVVKAKQRDGKCMQSRCLNS